MRRQNLNILLVGKLGVEKKKKIELKKVSDIGLRTTFLVTRTIFKLMSVCSHVCNIVLERNAALSGKHFLGRTRLLHGLREFPPYPSYEGENFQVLNRFSPTLPFVGDADLTLMFMRNTKRAVLKHRLCINFMLKF